MNPFNARNTIAAAIILVLGMSTHLALAAEESQAHPDACSLLTQAQVTAAFGLKVEPGARPVSTDPSICSWREEGKPTGPGRNVMITIIDASRFGAAKDKLPKAPPPSNLGLGDDAFFEKFGRFPVNLFLKSGTHYLRLMARTEVMSATAAETADEADKAVEKKLAAQILRQM